jgi:hypothetical protein
MRHDGQQHIIYYIVVKVHQYVVPRHYLLVHYQHQDLYVYVSMLVVVMYSIVMLVVLVMLVIGHLLD